MKLYWTSLNNQKIDGDIKVVADIGPFLPEVAKIKLLRVIDAFKNIDRQMSSQILGHLLNNMPSGSELSICEVHMELLCTHVGGDVIPYDVSMPYFERKSFLPLNFVIKMAQQSGWQVDTVSIGQVIDQYHYDLRMSKP